MATGFNLFSFDAFKLFTARKSDVDFERTERSVQAFAADDENREKDREREADIAFWGFAYYPVM